MKQDNLQIYHQQLSDDFGYVYRNGRQEALRDVQCMIKYLAQVRKESAKNRTPKKYLLGAILLPIVFILAGMAFSPGEKLDTSPPGYAVNFRIAVYQGPQLVRVCDCWRYIRYDWGYQLFCAGAEWCSPTLKPIMIEYGQAIEISELKGDQYD